MQILEYSNLPRYKFFPNVLGRILLNGERMTFFMAEIQAGGKVPLHSHPHEQMGICLAGEAEFIGGEKREVVRKGMVYRFESNEEHEVRILGSENGLFLDVFSPPRTEYVVMQKSLEKDHWGS